MGDAFSFLLSLIAVILVVLIIASAAVKIVKEYERGVIFRLGRLVGAKGPGLFFIIPLVDRMIKVDLRVVTLDIPAQEAITRDNVTVKVNAVAYFRVVNPSDAVVKVEDFRRATYQIAQTSLRSVIGQSELDDLLARRDEINARLQQIIDEQTEPWGIKVSIVEVKDVELPDTMKRAMAAQAEAERGKRAKVIAAEGEFMASQRLTEAAEVMGHQPAAIQLRYLQTLIEIAAERNSTIIFPVPIEFVRAFGSMFANKEEPGSES
jgi:regulator of protease activity HflC (stomatin/prohibitin superfamily)